MKNKKKTKKKIKNVNNFVLTYFSSKLTCNRHFIMPQRKPSLIHKKLLAKLYSVYRIHHRTKSTLVTFNV